MGNGQILDMDDSYRWDLFCNMSAQCLQDEQCQKYHSSITTIKLKAIVNEHLLSNQLVMLVFKQLSIRW